MRSHAWCAPLFFVLGCSGAEPRTPSPTPSTTGAPSGVTATKTDAAPSAVASASAPIEPAKPESPFFAVAKLPEASDVRVFGAGATVLVVAERYSPPGAKPTPDAMPDTTTAFFTVQGDKLVFLERDSAKESSFGRNIESLVGEWPEVDMVAVEPAGRTGAGGHLSHDKDHTWKETTDIEGVVFRGIAKVDASVVAHKSFLMFPWAGFKDEIVTLRGPAVSRTVTPVDRERCLDALYPGVSKADRPAQFLQPSAVNGLYLAATGGGALFSVGSLCTGEDAVETWEKGASKSTLQTLGQSLHGARGNFNPPAVTGAAGGPGDEGWIFGPTVFHHADHTWSKVDVPVSLLTGSVAPDGTVWAIGRDGNLFRGGVKGFSEVRVPSDAKVADLAITSDGTVWLAAGGALLRTKRSTDGASTVKVEDATKGGAPSKPRFQAGSQDCLNNLVVLYGFTKVTPDDYDFPLTRKALAGHTELSDVRFAVAKDRGQKYLVAVPTSLKEASALVDLVQKGVAGSKPAIVCANPEIVREVPDMLGAKASAKH